VDPPTAASIRTPAVKPLVASRPGTSTLDVEDLKFIDRIYETEAQLKKATSSISIGLHAREFASPFASRAASRSASSTRGVVCIRV